MVKVLDPTGVVLDQVPSLAPRIQSFEGATIGVVGIAPEAVERVGEILVSDFGASRSIIRQKDNISVPLEAEIFDELRGLVDCMVVGVGV